MSAVEQFSAERYDVELEREESGTYYTTHDMSEDGLTVTLAVALGEIADVDPVELVPSFPEYADPTALDQLFRTRPDGTPRESGRVVLSIEGHTVTVHSTGTIAIEAPGE